MSNSEFKIFDIEIEYQKEIADIKEKAKMENWSESQLSRLEILLKKKFLAKDKLTCAQRAERAAFNKIKNRVNSQDRKTDTRRKILAGACVLKASETDQEIFSLVKKILDECLVKDADRIIFGLAPKTPPKNEPKDPSTDEIS